MKFVVLAAAFMAGFAAGALRPGRLWAIDARYAAVAVLLALLLPCRSILEALIAAIGAGLLAGETLAAAAAAHPERSSRLYAWDLSARRSRRSSSAPSSCRRSASPRRA